MIFLNLIQVVLVNVKKQFDVFGKYASFSFREVDEEIDTTLVSVW